MNFIIRLGCKRIVKTQKEDYMKEILPLPRDYVENLANDFVQKKEDKDLYVLQSRIPPLETRAEGCKCLNCQRDRDHAKEHFDDELFRIFCPEDYVDHEEVLYEFQGTATQQK